MTPPVDREQELAQVAPGAVRPATDDDAVDGVGPRWVAEPETPEAAAAVLGWCTAHGQSVVIRGGGTRMSWGRPPSPVDVVLSTRKLTRITYYEPGDLTVTVEGGLAVATLNEALARHGQWLPIDVEAEAGTVGGTLATNDSGPLRHRFGSPRDQVIGVRLATADGRLASAGGRVVKNVAGYDLGKLVAGSFGGFAAIVSATFKLAPIPASSSTLVLTFRHGDALARAAGALAASQLDPISLEVGAVFEPGGRAPAVLQLFVRCGGPAAVNGEELDRAEAFADPFGPTERMRVEPDGDLWRTRARNLPGAAGATARLSWMPASLAAVMAILETIGRELPVRLTFAGRAAVGSGTVRIDGATADQVTAVERLRAEVDAVGHVVLARASRDVRERVDVWGPPSGADSVIQAIKRALDPAGILNAKRGPV